MKINNLLSIPIAMLLLVGCQSEKPAKDEAETTMSEEAKPDIYASLPTVIKNGLIAHGGLELWRSFGSLSYDIVKKDKVEHQLIDLHSRKVLITSDKYKIGFDGETAWISPNKDAMGGGSARFYQGVYFYFFALPHVLGDPGLNFETLPDKTIAGKTYDVVKVSYNDGVGDASGDYYVAHFDKSTHRLDWLLYTVTYFSGESHENYNAVNYEGWQEVGGLMVPTAFTSYIYKDGEIGEVRSKTEFDNIKFDTANPASSVFAKPEDAEVDSLLVKS